MGVQMSELQKTLSLEQRADLLRTLKVRFEQHPNRHAGLEWLSVLARLELRPEELWSLEQVEISGGEPDVVGHDSGTGEYVFYDCSSETPKGRRSLCYDRKALDSRKENKPVSDAISAATEMGIELLTESQYRDLQSFGSFDAKTSSWLATPVEIRKLGGAIFADYRFGRVFVYHNGAESYYGGRGFRGSLRV